MTKPKGGVFNSKACVITRFRIRHITQVTSGPNAIVVLFKA
ncbi:hypothetical protein OAH23_06445 [Verrucomicrobia bacterium]|nr:hypothetical protein [Verrucomicrobiota bacterium]